MTFVPVIPESYSHVLAEFESVDPLLSALRLDSSRLKCTSIAVSRKWLALGTSGGGLNLIQKEGWKHRLFLSHKEGAISQVACCLHDDDYVAVATRSCSCLGIKSRASWETRTNLCVFRTQRPKSYSSLLGHSYS